jgi:hypothetical protein
MTNKKTLLIGQVLITFMMALFMTGIFSCLALGFTPAWIAAWAKSFVLAWPIALCLSIPVGKIAFAIAGKVAGPAKAA